MSATITLPVSLSAEKYLTTLKLRLERIFRSQTAKLAIEVIAVLSLFTAAAIWSLAIPVL